MTDVLQPIAQLGCSPTLPEQPAGSPPPTARPLALEPQPRVPLRTHHAILQAAAQSPNQTTMTSNNYHGRQQQEASCENMVMA